jgi:general secretion pathway protein F
MHFEVRALREGNAVVALPVNALDIGDAKRQARNLGYTVLAVRPLRSWAGLGGARSARFPLVLFSQELLALLNAGLTLVESIEALTEKEHRPETRKVLEGLIARLREGHPLSTALRQFPLCFPELYAAMVRAAERTGDLPDVLTRYINYQTQVDQARRKLVSASIYPAVLLGVGGLVTIFLLTYVVPKFSRIYADMGGQLPLLSQLLMKWGQLLESHGLETALVFLAAFAGLTWALTRPAAHTWLLDRLVRIPAVHVRLQVYQLARFYRTLGMLQRGGIPIIDALTMAGGLLQPVWRVRLTQAQEEIRTGRSISQAMETNGLTTPVALRMLRVGERSGNMNEMMERIAAFYDEENARWVDWVTRLIEPALMTVIGIVIGTIVVLMYIPIFELAGGLQ